MYVREWLVAAADGGVRNPVAINNTLQMRPHWVIVMVPSRGRDVIPITHPWALTERGRSPRAPRVPYQSRVIAVLLLCWYSTGAWGQNIVINGGFDGTTYTATFGSVTDVLPSNWALVPASSTNINVVSAAEFPGFPDPDGGGFYVAFMSTSRDGTQDCFLQDFPTVAGHAYTLSFKAAITSASPYLELLPDWDELGSNRTEIPVHGFNANGGPTSSAGPLAFQTFTFTNLIASSSVTRFYFHGVDSQGAILVDSVTLTPQSTAGDAPLPLWSLGALGTTLLGLGSWRRAGRKTAAKINPSV
jgi:hypothetical protein